MAQLLLVVMLARGGCGGALLNGLRCELLLLAFQNLVEGVGVLGGVDRVNPAACQGLRQSGCRLFVVGGGSRLDLLLRAGLRKDQFICRFSALLLTRFVLLRLSIACHVIAVVGQTGRVGILPHG